MIVYSVTVNIEDTAHEDWLQWMKEVHIPDVMQTGMFKQHRMLRLLSRDEEEKGFTYNIQYSCPSLEMLDQYQKEFAPALQKEHTDRYAGKFVAFRTLLEEVE